MHSTIRLLSARVHQPLIRFGRRSQPSARAHAHPFAPLESKRSFDDFVRRQNTQLALESSTSPDEVAADKSKKVYRDFWEIPERYWKHDLEDHEINAIQSGGASLR